jgi:K+-sensing histidine kinase KdpD
VSIDVSRGSESVTITITDNGPGIPEMERKILTEGIKETPTYHSQGLGLWLTQLVVGQSDGTIHLHEDASRGTEISVVLRRDLTDRAR